MQATPSGRNYYPRPPSVHVPHTPIQLTTPGAKMETAIADVKRSQLLRKNFGAPAGLPSARVRSLSPARHALDLDRARARRVVGAFAQAVDAGRRPRAVPGGPLRLRAL